MPSILSQSFNGLVFRDQFNRADEQLDVSANWLRTDGVGLDNLVSNEVVPQSPYGDAQTTGIASVPSSSIHQVNFIQAVGSFGAYWARNRLSPNQNNDGVYIEWNTGLGNYKIVIEKANTIHAQDNPGDLGTVSQTGRIVIEDVGASGIKARFYRKQIGSRTDITSSLDQVGVELSASVANTPVLTDIFRVTNGAAANNWDEVMIFGRNIVFNNMPTGSHLVVEGIGSIVSESANVITWDIDSVAMPIEASMSIFSGSVLEAEFAGGNSVFGGSIFEITVPQSHSLSGVVHGQSVMDSNLATEQRISEAFAIGQAHAFGDLLIAKNIETANAHGVATANALLNLDLKIAGESYGTALANAELTEVSEALLGTLHGQSQAQGNLRMDFGPSGFIQGQAYSFAVIPKILTFEASMSRVTEGLIFRDQFNRADQFLSESVSWSLHTGDQFIIETNRLRTEGVNTATNAFGAQVSDKSTITQANFVLQETADVHMWQQLGSNANEIAAVLNEDLQQLQIRVRKAGVPQVATVGLTLNNGSPYSLRLLTASGSGVFGAVATVANASSLTNLTSDFTTSIGDNALDSEFPPPTDFGMIGAGVDGAARGEADEFFTCGRNIEVIGLDDTYTSARIVGPAVTRSFEASVNGTASIDVDLLALPATSVEVLDINGNVINSITPADGVWGGDVYQANLASVSGTLQILGAIHGQSVMDAKLGASQRILDALAFGQAQSFGDLLITKNVEAADAFGQAMAYALLTEIPEVHTGLVHGQATAYALANRIRGLVAQANGTSAAYALLGQINIDQLAGVSHGVAQMAADLSVAFKLGTSTVHGQAQADARLSAKFVANFISTVVGEANADAVLSIRHRPEATVQGDSSMDGTMRLILRPSGYAQGYACAFARTSVFIKAGLANVHGQSLTHAWLGFQVEFLGQAPFIMVVDDPLVEQVTLDDAEIVQVTVDDAKVVQVFMDRN